MKKIFLIICFLLLTGCSVNYDIVIDNGSILEDTKIMGADSVMYKVYSTKPIPLSKEAPIQSESDEKLDNVLYYDVKDISSLEENGLEFSGTFDKKIPISDSNILSFASGKVSSVRDESKVTITIPRGLKAFKQYKDLEEVKVNINCKYKSISNNADSVSGDNYTWIINRDNYETKDIIFAYDEKGIMDNLNNNPMIMFSICVLFIVIICFAIYLFINMKYSKNNSL